MMLFASILISFMFVGAVIGMTELAAAYTYQRLVIEQIPDQRHPLRNGARARIEIGWFQLGQIFTLLGMLAVRMIADPIDFTRLVEWFRVGLFAALVVSIWRVQVIQAHVRSRDEFWHGFQRTHNTSKGV